MDEGLEQLVRGLVEQLRHHEDRATIYTNKPVTDIQFTESGKAKVGCIAQSPGTPVLNTEACWEKRLDRTKICTRLVVARPTCAN